MNKKNVRLFNYNKFIFHLVTHEDERTVEDIFHRTYMASWLLRLIKTTNYFPENIKTPDVSEVQLSKEELFIGQLILHNLQLLQFNTHEVKYNYYSFNSRPQHFFQIPSS